MKYIIYYVYLQNEKGKDQNTSTEVLGEQIRNKL